jgi:hypothetical protein
LLCNDIRTEYDQKQGGRKNFSIGLISL